MQELCILRKYTVITPYLNSLHLKPVTIQISTKQIDLQLQFHYLFLQVLHNYTRTLTTIKAIMR